MKDSTQAMENELLLTPTDTRMAKVLENAIEMLEKFPQILTRIRGDQERAGKEAKVPRVLDKQWEADRMLALPFEFMLMDANPKSDLSADDLELEVGRPRLRPEVVYLFHTLNGCYGSICSQSCWDCVKDSMTLRYFLQPYVNRLPGRTTVIDNLKAMTEATRCFILDCQLSHVIDLGLDDFNEQTIDSTSADSSSAWPTEVHLIQRMVNEAYRLGQKLDEFGLSNFRKWRIPVWLEELDRLEFEIDLASTRRPRQFKKKYRQFVKRAKDLLDRLAGEFERAENSVKCAALKPSVRIVLNRLWERLEAALSEGYILLDYTADRVLGSGKTDRDPHERIFSVSDRSARFILKGQRDSVFGYKIQLSRSANGFISSVLVPEGNAADSDQLFPMVQEHIRRTGVIPELVSTDDGYSSAAGLAKVKSLGVHDVSLSGSKGKKLTPLADWDSELYRQARNDRSAVESLMFTGKHCFEFGQFHRRGIDGVRCEMLDKVIAYNFWRMSYERDRQAEALMKQKRKAA